MSLEQDLDDVLTSILFIKSGAIHPSIIQIENLYRELLSSSHMRSDKNLVLPITLANMHGILESCTITSYIYMNKINYILEFPLIKNDKFTLYHMYSIPIMLPDTHLYSTILPEQTYLAISSTGQQYASTNNLDNCKIYAPARRVCDLPIYNYNTRAICEVAILMSNNKQVPSSCETTTFSAQINTFQRIATNKWIFIVHQPTPCVLQCDGTTTHHEIKNAGILNLKPGCKIYSSFITLSATEDISYNISHPLLTVDIAEDCIELKTIPDSPELLPLKINNVPLDSLNTIKEELRKQSQHLKDSTQNNNIISKLSTFSITSFIIGTIILILLLRKIYQRLSRRKDHRRGWGCIQIFNNCFDRRRQRTHVAIPMTSTFITSRSASTTEDEDTDEHHTPNRQSLPTKGQSLF